MIFGNLYGDWKSLLKIESQNEVLLNYVDLLDFYSFLQTKCFSHALCAWVHRC